MIILVPAFVMIVGLLIWLLAVREPIKEMGHDMFWCGLLVTLLDIGPSVVSFWGNHVH